ncbi:flagellar basal body rod modification protein [Clostridium homopropionicum DSM 5847]|uniref:Basal-body rod modification protein FlgD n=1 Tax=Clostridium homopropionicum DSM 5847 TaxID=1121318 RepID=A0A0L6ZDG6_9CLOT|nr:flagellar hook capping FlgD N-terminal domain-containing protein [Clostridium homopropionicum]KOA21010.1 flagellar basal body rod modification protein [Clostridium homopropionicum DSM 5847]SFF99561.1 flagellar basal-body rod modification protein FlgD [Clostridium homopropionicum]
MIDTVAASQTATERGTKIVKKGQEMDKNAFLRILTAELTNQDPMNAKDSTAYVSQLAQFSSLEQMANLNSTMTFTSASNLVGKTVALDVYDDYGKQYGGIVNNVSKVGDTITVTVNVAKYKGDEIVGYEDKDFDFKEVSDILDVPDDKSQILTYLSQNISYLNQNINFMTASSLINKSVDLKSSSDNEEYSGTVKEVYKASDGIKMKVIIDEEGTEKEFSYGELIKVK